MSMAVDRSEGGAGSVVSIIGQVILISIVTIIGWKIALPGIDPSFMEAQTRQGLPSQLSILALGVGPILTAFALGQIIRLVFPGTENSVVLYVAESVLALAIAASQAYGIAQALSSMGLISDLSYLGMLGIIGTLLGGTAVLLVLSRRLILPCLAIGFWIVWLLPAMVDLPSHFSLWFEMLRTGAVAGFQLLISLAVLVALAAFSIFVVRAVLSAYHKDLSEASTPVAVLQIVVWPPLLAASAGGYLLTPLAFLAPESLPDADWLRAFVLAITAIFIPVFVFGYRRLFARKGVTLPVATMLVLAATQIVLVVGGALAAQSLVLALPLSGTTIIVFVAVIFTIMDALRGRSLETRQA